MVDSAPKREISRHLTPDRRNSMKAHLFGNREQSVARMWYSKFVKKETMPLLLAIGGACVLCTGYMARHAMFNPDVKINKSARSSGEPPSQAKGEAWVTHKKGLATMTSHVPEERKVAK